MTSSSVRPKRRPAGNGRAPDATEKRITLLLQGGGALGSYQAGAYEALAEQDYHPDLIIGVSIGAINASLIVGNRPERRVERLREFWERVTTPQSGFISSPLPMHGVTERRLSTLNAILFGQPGFFRPRLPFDFIADNPLSFYDTAHLRQTLLELVDFDLINSGANRLAVGAVQVRTGNMIYFDSIGCQITPEHIMASGALPPGFPPVEIDGEAYWDGGIVSNTPLEYMMRCEPRHDSLAFQVDLFSAHGQMPTSLDGVAEREKDIRYSSRTRYGTDAERDRQDLRCRIGVFLEKLPPALREDPIAKRLAHFSCPAKIDVVHLIYRPDEPEGANKDVQFDRSTAERRWRHGREDAVRALDAAPWREPHPPELGMRTFDIAKAIS